MDSLFRQNICILEFYKEKKLYQFFERNIQITRNKKRKIISYEKIKKVKICEEKIVIYFYFPNLPIYVPKDNKNIDNFELFLKRRLESIQKIK